MIKTIKAIPEEKLTKELSDALKPGFKTNVLYRSRSDEAESKLKILLNLCTDALAILKTEEDPKDPDAVRIAQRFLSEQSVLDAKENKVIPRAKEEITTDSLQSAYDEDATYRRKGDVKQSGYLLEVTETCGEDNPFQLITDYDVTTNNTSDARILEDRMENIKENTGCSDIYADGGFHSEEVHELAKEKDIDIHLTNMTGKETTKKIPVTDFEIDPKTNLIRKCPGGYEAAHAKADNNQISGHFAHECCEGCELYDRCYSKRQKKDHVVRISVKSLNAARQRIRIKKDKKANTSKRADIEGTNSALKRTGHANLYVSGMKVTAQNIKRFIKYKQGGYDKNKKDRSIRGITVPVTG